jgi:tRNA (guanine-N7-)-methyltransferase
MQASPQPKDVSHRKYIVTDEIIPRRDLPGFLSTPTQPVIAEFGIGRGRIFSLMANQYPETFFIGVDLFFGPLNDTAKKLSRWGSKNTLLLRYNLVQPALIFPNHFLDGIIVNFPDPWPKKKHTRHRLFYGPAATHIKQILKPGGWVFLQTDQKFYIEDAVQQLQEASFKVKKDVVPDIWKPTFKSGFQLLFEHKKEPFYRVLACT